MARVCVVGSWHLASVSSVCLAHLGHRVWGVSEDERAIQALAAGNPPVFEPGLQAMLKKQLKTGRLRYTSRFQDAVRDASFVTIALDTPVREDDSPDLDAIWRAVRAVMEALKKPVTLVVNSQVPVGTSDEIFAFMRTRRPRMKCEIAYNPEFLQLGVAVDRFLRPDRIVIGAQTRETVRRVGRLYSKLRRPVVMTDLRTAEMIKHASNSFLATSISFANEIAGICELVGADFWRVGQAMRMDQRIGPHAYLNAGLGFGGGTLGRDLRALQKLARREGRATPLVDAVVEVNERQRTWVIERLRSLLGNLVGRRIGVLGLTYKAGTDTLRRSQALETIQQLREDGAAVMAYDPLVDPQDLHELIPDVGFHQNVYHAAEGCDALVLITVGTDMEKWDFARLAGGMRRRLFLDCRHAIDPNMMLRHGFVYVTPGSGLVQQEKRAT
jgi:UDPglucose 6-dehydrogenase